MHPQALPNLADFTVDFKIFLKIFIKILSCEADGFCYYLMQNLPVEIRIELCLIAMGLLLN